MLKPIVSFCLSLALTSCGTQTLYDRGSELDRLISSGSKALSDKQYSQAEAIFLELMKKAERSNPNSREYNLSLHKLAEVYFEQGQYTKAEPLLQKGLALDKKRLGEDHVEVGNTLNNLGEVYREQHLYADAEHFHREAVRIREKARGPNDHLVAHSSYNLGRLYFQQNRLREAEPWYERALAIWANSLEPADFKIASTCFELAETQLSLGHFSEAERSYECAEPGMQKLFRPPQAVGALTFWNHFALAYANQRKFSQAEPLFERSLAAAEQIYGPEHEVVAAAASSLAQARVDQRKYGEAAPLFRRAIGIFEKALSSNAPQLIGAVEGYALALEGLGRHSEASEVRMRAQQLKRKPRA